MLFTGFLVFFLAIFKLFNIIEIKWWQVFVPYLLLIIYFILSVIKQWIYSKLGMED